MFRRRNNRKGELGTTVVEFAIGGMIFFTVVFGVIEFGRLLWTHNALVDATRRGARYAVINKNTGTVVTSAGNVSVINAIKNVTVYNDPAGAASGKNPLVSGLTTNKVIVTHYGSGIYAYGSNLGSAEVKITGYTFNFVVGLVGTYVNLPEYKTSLPAECAGYVPDNLP